MLEDIQKGEGHKNPNDKSHTMVKAYYKTLPWDGFFLVVSRFETTQ